jgi:arylsulfatase
VTLAEALKAGGPICKGLGALRAARHATQFANGILKPDWKLTERDSRVPRWERASFKEWEQRRMEVYAAQIDRLDGT